MAKGRGGRKPSRLDLRREAEAAEAREREEAEEAEKADEIEEPDDDEPDLDDDDIDAFAEVDDEDVDETDDLGDELSDELDEDEAPKPKKKKKKKAAEKKTTVKRPRPAKEVRRQAVWVVFDNANKVVEEFPYNKKAEAEALLAKKLQEKEGKATYYLNLVKKEIKE